MIAPTVMPEIHSDFTACQCTDPATASLPWTSNMRGERNELAQAASAASTGSLAGSLECKAPRTGAVPLGWESRARFKFNTSWRASQALMHLLVPGAVQHE